MSQLLAPAPAARKALPTSPYVGLVPFREEDSDFFFGREAEKEIVTGNLRATRLTIVYGSSGVGKTSLLRAGVVHDLRELVLAHAASRPERAPFAVCTFRAWRDQPLAGLVEAIRASVAEALGDGAVWPAPAGESFVESLRSWTRRVRTLLVVLDQFEDYFLYHPGEDGEGTFAVEFPRALNEPNLRVNFLLSIREDSWAKLDRFEGRIPHLFANYVRVEPLSRDAARRAIEGPIAAWNAGLPMGEEPYRVEPALAETVLAAAAAGRLTLAAAGDAPRVEPVSPDAVEPPFLQLVMERLWQATVAADEHVLGVARLEELGGAQRIVANHLRDSLAVLTIAEQAVASDVFRFLVTRSRTKIAHSAGDLAEWTKRPETEVTAVLDELCSPECGRILRPVVPPAGAEEDRRYEIFHDVLADAVLVWRRDFEAHAALELERETAARRHRRLLVIAVGAALLAAAMVALAVYAFAQRNEAAKQQSNAQTLAKVAHIEAGKAKRAEKKAIVAEEAAKASAAEAQAAGRRQAEQSEQEAEQSAATANTANAAAQQSAFEANAASTLAESNRKRAVHQADLARAAERRARSQAQHAKARALAEKARALLLVDPVQSVRRALEAQSRERSPLTEDALRASVVADRLRAVVPGGGGAVRTAMFSPDGSRILTLAERRRRAALPRGRTTRAEARLGTGGGHDVQPGRIARRGGGHRRGPPLEREGRLIRPHPLVRRGESGALHRRGRHGRLLRRRPTRRRGRRGRRNGVERRRRRARRIPARRDRHVRHARRRRRTARDRRHRLRAPPTDAHLRRRERLARAPVAGAGNHERDVQPRRRLGRDDEQRQDGANLGRRHREPAREHVERRPSAARRVQP